MVKLDEKVEQKVKQIGYVASDRVGRPNMTAGFDCSKQLALFFLQLAIERYHPSQPSTCPAHDPLHVFSYSCQI